MVQQCECSLCVTQLLAACSPRCTFATVGLSSMIGTARLCSVRILEVWWFPFGLRGRLVSPVFVNKAAPRSSRMGLERSVIARLRLEAYECALASTLMRHFLAFVLATTRRSLAFVSHDMN